ncbi:hypothetical protein Y032_0073g768 [Ancylostoma ceylanicum]|uniref:G-protein coupled receptors family 1 profile domain-containing protein n=1 Tax=Ancylostoma ceylanicum TaxID=53326 RepID=A0A016TVT2_9BILA|nr:hypothetical protein Y032_0073g768 [Ancylostoma ceylanicum]
MILLIRNWTGIDAVDYSILCSLSLLEAFLLFIDIIVFGVALYLAVQAPFHWNLRILVTVVLSQYYISLFSRLILLSFQLGLFTIHGEFETNPVVLCCSLSRSYYISVVCTGLSNVFVERCIATVLVSDYEKKLRKYIGVTLSISTVIWSAILTPILVYEIVPWIITAISIASSSVMATTLFVLLHRKNQLRYRRLSKHHRIMYSSSKMQYTLSIRFQLNENLRTMKLLRNIIVMCGCMNILSFVLYTGVRSDWLHFNSEVAGHYYDAAFNITLAIYASLIPVTAYYSDDTYRSIAKNLPVIGRFVQLQTATSPPELKISEETDFHFKNLQKQWDVPTTTTTKVEPI